MLSMYASWCTYDGVSMSFTWSFHAVFILSISLFCWCRDLQGTSMESPWNLHGNSIKTTFEYKMAQKSRAKKETCWDCFCWKLHQTSIKTPWNLHGNSIKTTFEYKMAQKSWAKKETCWDCFCWKLHQTSIKTPWNLHGICMSQTIGTSKGRAPKTYIKTPWNLHQFSWKWLRKLCKNDPWSY